MKKKQEIPISPRFSHTNALIFFLVIVLGLAVPLGMLVRTRMERMQSVQTGEGVRP
jgi:hypothetical protein